jgi:hypothetical protein
MKTPESVLPHILERVLPYLEKENSRKIAAVRWFNRLYFDVEKWNQDFISLLRTFPKTGTRASKTALSAFDDRLEKFSQALDGRWTAEKWDLCCNLRMLSARFARDFAWLEKEDKNCYWELRRLIDEAYGNENTIVDQAKRVTNEIRYERTQGEKSNEKIVGLVDSYVRESRSSVDELQRVAEKAGIQLLTVEQYELALRTDGSLDARLLVLGDVTMGHKIQAGDNAIINVDSALHNVTQSIQVGKSLTKGQKSSLSKLMKRLSKELSKIKTSHETEVEVIAGRMQEVANQVAQPAEKRKDSLLQLSGKGLVDAAKTVAQVAPFALSTAKEIATFIANLG